jgi:hypothetical protein
MPQDPSAGDHIRPGCAGRGTPGCALSRRPSSEPDDRPGLIENDDQQDAKDDKRPCRHCAVAWSCVDMVDVEIARDVSSVDDAGPFGVSSSQDSGLDATGEPRLTKQITHDLGMFGPDVRQLPHPSSELVACLVNMAALDRRVEPWSQHSSGAGPRRRAGWYSRRCSRRARCCATASRMTIVSRCGDFRVTTSIVRAPGRSSCRSPESPGAFSSPNANRRWRTAGLHEFVRCPLNSE